jgi:hypothetical protein
LYIVKKIKKLNKVKERKEKKGGKKRKKNESYHVPIKSEGNTACHYSS